jgi:hypothetical protein
MSAIHTSGHDPAVSPVDIPSRRSQGYRVIEVSRFCDWGRPSDEIALDTEGVSAMYM